MVTQRIILLRILCLQFYTKLLPVFILILLFTLELHGKGSHNKELFVLPVLFVFIKNKILFRTRLYNYV